MARRQRAAVTRLGILLHCFQAINASLPCGELRLRRCIDLMLPQGGQTMRWKISHHGHDPRQIDLFAVFALLVIIVAAYLYFTRNPNVPSTTAFIVPSQSVHW
jgi:hypothetical protein